MKDLLHPVMIGGIGLTIGLGYLMFTILGNDPLMLIFGAIILYQFWRHLIYPNVKGHIAALNQNKKEKKEKNPYKYSPDDFKKYEHKK